MGRFSQIFLLLTLTLGCGSPPDSEPPLSLTDESALSYARGFEVSYQSGIKIITVTQPWAEAQHPLRYALLSADQKLPAEMVVDQVISVPVKKIVVTSTTHIPAMDLLQSTDALVGFPHTDYISNTSVRRAIDSGKVMDLGAANGLNLELLVTAQPDLLITYKSGNDVSQINALRSTSIPMVYNTDFLESTPLGRAEWIKFVGHFLGKEDLADSIFHYIEGRYQQLKNLVKDLDSKPEVFSGSMYSGTWFAPGGNSYVAQFIEDAGGTYTWQDLDQRGSVELSFESVLARNQETTFWLGLGAFTSLDQLLAADQRYQHFKAFQDGTVYNYHKRIGATGGYEYLEMGVARPDLILEDFIKILHPSVIPDPDLYFFEKLN